MLLHVLYSLITALPEKPLDEEPSVALSETDCYKIAIPFQGRRQRRSIQQMLVRLPIGKFFMMLPPRSGSLEYWILIKLIPRLRSAVKVTIGLIELLIDHDQHIFQKCGLESMVSCLHTLVVKPRDYQCYIDTLKYSVEWMHARSLKQTLPLMPDSLRIESEGNNCLLKNPTPLLFEGAVRRWLKNRLVSLSDKNQHLFWSLAQIKRCADVVPSLFIQKGLEKHRAAMARPSGGVEPEFKSLMKEKFCQIIKGLVFDEIDKVHEYTSSACWESSVKYGGGKSHLLYQFVSLGYTNNDELIQMSYHPRSGVSEMHGFITMDLSDMIRECSLDTCQAKVYPVCEPLKVRNITKSNALPYAIVKGFQLDLHRHMRNKFQFQLIGESLNQRHIEDLVARSPSGIFASGDFSAATDNVKIEFTKMFHELCLTYLDGCRPETSGKFLGILRNVLYEHDIHYPRNGEYEVLDPIRQQNGQLMGSVLSFTVLCAINLAAYWVSVEPDVLNIKDLNVLINGDDILFRTTQEKYDTWLRNVTKAGLTPSPGKNFFHGSYCTINSEMFSIHRNIVTHIPFHNVGMLLGQSKVARSSKKSKPVHCLHSDAVSGAFNQSRANARFLYYNREKLVKCSRAPDGTQLNYYLPRELGGLGMKLNNLSYISAERYIKMTTTDKKQMYPYTIVTGAQRKIAKYLLDRWTTPYLKSPCKPIGFEVDLDREKAGFHPLPNDDYHILVPLDCPQPPWTREKKRDFNPPNWCCEPTDSFELERLKFQFSGVRLYRSAKLTVPNVALKTEWKEYKWVGDGYLDWNSNDQ